MRIIAKYQAERARGRGASRADEDGVHSERGGYAAGKGRDAERRPMQWDCSENMGFSTARPWLEPNYTGDWKQRTVENQEKDPGSMLALYRNIIRLRKERTEIGRTDAVFCDDVPDGVLSYRFVKDGRCTAVVLNMSGRECRTSMEKTAPGIGGLKVALTSRNDVAVTVREDCLLIPPYSGVILTN